MALTDADICNVALTRIGVRKSIDSLEDASAEARACNLVFEHLREKLLEGFWWPFATKRADLAILEDEERSGWEYVFALPEDCLAPQYVWTGVRNPPVEDRIPFEIEANEALDGQVFLCDQEDVELVYTARVTNPGTFSPTFADVLAWMVAAEVAPSLTGKTSLRQEALVGARVALGEAKVAAARAKSPVASPLPGTIRART